MHLLFKCIILFFLTTGVSFSGLFNHQTFTLQNGLRVYILPHAFSPMVNVALYYQIGTADDPRHQHGLSHFVEHMLFKGTQKVQKGVFDALMLQQGALYNAHTTPDYTVYDATIAKDQLELVLFLESDRMRHLTFTEEDVRFEREVVHEERAMRLDNSPFGKVTEVYLKSLYWKHPYGISAIGYPEHIDAYDYGAVRQHYETYYVPNNAILVITGDVDVHTVQPLVEKYFGSFQKKDLPKRVRMEEPSHEGTLFSLTHYAARSYLTSLALSYASPCFFSHDKEHVLPLIILVNILTGNELSRFYKLFVEDEKILASIYIDYRYASLNPTPLEIEMVLGEGVSVDTLQRRMEDEIGKLVREGITEDEVSRAKKDLVGQLAFMKDGVHGMASAFSGIAVGVPLDLLEDWDKHLNAVTKEQVNASIKHVFGKQKLGSMILYPQTEQNLIHQVNSSNTSSFFLVFFEKIKHWVQKVIH